VCIYMISLIQKSVVRECWLCTVDVVEQLGLLHRAGSKLACS